MIKVCIPTTIGRRQRLSNCIRAVAENSNYPHELVIFENSLGGWVVAVRKMIKDLGSDPVVVIGDDTLPQKDWLAILANAYVARFPNKEGLAQPDDGHHKGRIASYPMATPAYLLHWIYSGYKHNYADKELRNAASSRGEYLWVAESKVTHQHYEEHPELYDETYDLQKGTRGDDRALYNQRETASNHYQNLKAIVWDELI